MIGKEQWCAGDKLASSKRKRRESLILFKICWFSSFYPLPSFVHEGIHENTGLFIIVSCIKFKLIEIMLYDQE